MLFPICLIFLLYHKHVTCMWDKEVICPDICTCRLEHISETPIHRFMQQEKVKDAPAAEAVVLKNNDVFYEDDEFDGVDPNHFVRSTTCIVQTETVVKQLIDEIPKEVQSITLIQASDSGNKSMRFSYFAQFLELKILELQSARKLSRNTTSHFLCEIDKPIQQLEYINLERVLLNSSEIRFKLSDDVGDDVEFEYVQKGERDTHPLTFVQRGTHAKIVPYKTYKEDREGNSSPLFKGFANLLLLRIYECELHNVNWEMFEGLATLKYLILEKNKLRFIPDFAFYGTPNLRSLSLAYNDLLNIQITDLAGLLELEYLDLSHNNFSQLSELSLPPFPKIKLANFANNPITVVYPNTFEVMNMTDSLILGGLDEPLSLMIKSFAGLKLLSKLTLLQLDIPLLTRDILSGMPNLKNLVMTGNIPEIQYDAFLEVFNLDTLIISKCNLSKLSVDSFIGLDKLTLLDVSSNNLSSLSPGIFDNLFNLHELYLNDNKFTTLPKDIFSKIHPRLIRLNDNPWHCSCEMSDWKPMLINKIKQKSIIACDSRYDKGQGCTVENTVHYKYIYENRVSPKCSTPKKYENWSVFHVMRKQYKCPEFKPKLRKKLRIKVHNLSASIEKAVSNLSTVESVQETSTESKVFAASNSLEHIKLEKLNRKLARKMKLEKALRWTSMKKSGSDLVNSDEVGNNVIPLNF